jgi:hypothetical protein
MSLLDDYRAYRALAKELNTKVMQAYLDRALLDRAGSLLGMLHGGTLVVENEGEMSVFMDFALHDLQVAGKNAFERYRQQLDGEHPAEHQLLAALSKSSTSLFQVSAVAPGEGTLLLADVLHGGLPLPLVDVNFSRSVVPGVRLFFRPVQIGAITMTTGSCLVFPRPIERAVRQQEQRLRRSLQHESAAVRRFVACFRLSRTQGLDVRYAEVAG